MLTEPRNQAYFEDDSTTMRDYVKVPFPPKYERKKKKGLENKGHFHLLTKPFLNEVLLLAEPLPEEVPHLLGLQHLPDYAQVG